MITFSFLFNFLLFSELAIAFCLLLFIFITYCCYFVKGHHEFTGLEEIAIQAFHMKDLSNLTGAGAKAFPVARYGIPDFCDTKCSAGRPGLPEISPKQRVTYTHANQGGGLEIYSVGRSGLPLW